MKNSTIVSLILAGAVLGPAPVLLSSTAFAAGGAPVRVASLVPFVSDAAARLPDDRVVLVATVRRSPTSSVSGAADLGSPHSPSIEALAGARPDVIVTDGAMHAALAPRLESVAPLVIVDATSVDATFDSLVAFGRAVNAESEMRAHVEEARDALAAQRAPRPVPTLALFGTPSAFLTITNRTWLGDLLRTIDLENLGGGQSGQERFPGFVAVSDEVLATLRPELILVVVHGAPAAIEGALDARTREGGPWHALGDGARVHVLDAERFGSNPGLDMPAVARELRALAGGGDGA